jgi:hypothetical protein
MAQGMSESKILLFPRIKNKQVTSQHRDFRCSAEQSEVAVPEVTLRERGRELKDGG